MPFKFERLYIPEVVHIKPKIFTDERGFFLEVFKQSEFKSFGIKDPFIQGNLSFSKRDVLRGLHYQRLPKAQGKLVICLKGEIFDVAVDIRKGSPTFSRWVSAILSEKTRNMLWIPEGFAHGFLVLSDYAEVLYVVTGSEYAPQYEGGIIWKDPYIGINWPLEGIKEPILSPKDRVLPRLSELQEGDLL